MSSYFAGSVTGGDCASVKSTNQATDPTASSPVTGGIGMSYIAGSVAVGNCAASPTDQAAGTTTTSCGLGTTVSMGVI